jgi:tetratricopeptide (TPR) repeat protein/CheY-like chemotaxis protein
MVAGQGRRILIVQEDSVEAGLLAFHLKQASMTALVATTTQEAWDAVGWGPPEVVVAELKTENIDGLEVVGGLVGKEVAVFLIADGIPTPEEELEALDRGVREIFTKPLDHRIMAARIATAKLRTMEEGDTSETAPIRGWLEDHPITSLLDMCRRLKLNARLVVELPNGEGGHLVIREGKVIDGVRGEHAGRDAVFTVMALATGKFTLTPVVSNDPLLEGADRVRMDLASLLEASTRPRDRTGAPTVSPRTARRPRTKTGLTTLDDLEVPENADADADADAGPATIVSEAPPRMQVETAGAGSGPTTVPDTISSHLAMETPLSRGDAYAPTYISDRPFAAPETQPGGDDDPPQADEAGTRDDVMVFPDDDMMDSLPTGPVDPGAPTTAQELIRALADADPFEETEEAFKALTTRDVEEALEPAVAAEADDEEDDDLDLAVGDFDDVDPLKTHHPTGEHDQVEGPDITDEYAQVVGPDTARTDEDEERAALEVGLGDDDGDDLDPGTEDEAVTQPGIEAREQTVAQLAPDVPMDHEPGPETLVAIAAAMPGYGKKKWMGRTLLIGLALAFLGLGGLVIYRLMAKAPDTSPAAGLATGGEAAPVEEPAEPAQATDVERATESYGRGNLAIEDGEVDQAMDHYREALAVDPDHAGALAGLSAALIDAERYEDAQPMLEELLRVAPSEASAHLSLGLVAHKLDDQANRTKALNTYIELAPDSPHRTEILKLIAGGEVHEGEVVPD